MSNSFLTKNQNYKLLSFCIFGFLILFMNSLYAHGIGGKDALYLQQNSGQAMPIFIYLGAKHMITGYDHLLYLYGVIFFLFRLNHPAITQRICMKQLLLRQSQPNQQISPL